MWLNKFRYEHFFKCDIFLKLALRCIPLNIRLLDIIIQFLNYEYLILTHRLLTHTSISIYNIKYYNIIIIIVNIQVTFSKPIIINSIFFYYFLYALL